MEYLKTTHATSSSQQSKTLIQAVDFTFRAIEEGLPKARKRYASKLEQAEQSYLKSTTSSGRSTLMGSGDDESNSRPAYFARMETLYQNSISKLDGIEAELGMK